VRKNAFALVYPPSGRNVFGGGQNSKFEKSIIADNESPDCLNVIFDAGSVGTRYGFSKVNTATVGSFVCEGLYTRRGTNNAETMVAFYNGSGYTLNGTSLVTVPSAQSIFTVATRIGSAQMENHIFFGNGGVTPYKYNGTNFTRHGVPAATQTGSFLTGGAGNPNGGYTYKFSFVNSQTVEGNVSTASTTITVANAQISITSIPVAPISHGVSSRRVYRTVAGGTSWLRLTTINDNTTTVFVDNVADASLGAAAPSDKGEPPKYSMIVYHQNRLFMNDNDNPNLVWYTDLNEPYTVGSLNFLTVGDGSTDFIKALGVQDNSLVCFGERNVWIVYMASTTPSDWKIVKAKSSFSSKSPYGVFEYNNRTGFPAVQNNKFIGIAALAGDTAEPTKSLLTVGTASGYLKSYRIEPDMFDVQESYLGNVSSFVFKNKVYISLTKGTGQTTNNRVYVMDFSNEGLIDNQTESWCPWTGLNVAQFTEYSGSLYYGTSIASGYLYKQSTTVYSDDGVAINSYFWTKEFAGYKGEESYSKDFRFTNLLVDLAGDYFMDLTVRTDSDLGGGTAYQVDLDPNASIWGTIIWGSGTWGLGDAQRDIQVPLQGARGKRVQYKFSNQNTINQRFKVHWQNFTYNLKGPR